ncbi:MAG TPA: helix-turn-helix transcriptional regulator [Amnibacterium sp.]|jgi:DNA-binding CsgD family transcriptional regulator|nr:helix-turn-helix transcriptional regulator [Amnibacterium sp.]
MATAELRLRAAERIGSLSRRGLDVAALWRACDPVIHEIVPFMLRPCWFTMDPASLIVTSHYDAAIPSLPPDALAHEYEADDAMTLSRIVRSSSGVATVHEATGGDPATSEGWRRFVQPYGGDQQLAVALRGRSGVAQGVLTLYREPGAPTFTVEDVAFLRSLSADLAAGAARGLLLGEAEEQGPNAPVLLVLDEDWQLQSMTPGAEAVVATLPGGGSWRERGTLPPVVLSLAASALASADTTDEQRSARVRTEDGRWLTLHGSPLVSDGRRRAAVIVERTPPDRISPLLMEAYGLTEREKDVTRHVLQGEPTAGIAAALFVSPETVQQHLKHVFEKTGVHSRRELVAKVFHAHYEPRVHDNDERIASGRPVIGSPVPPTGRPDGRTGRGAVNSRRRET